MDFRHTATHPLALAVATFAAAAMASPVVRPVPPVPEPIPEAIDAPPPPPAPAPAGTATTGATTPRLPDGRCDHCGSCVGVRRECVVKPVVREKKKVCYDATSVPHCIPGRSLFCGTCRGRDECGCYEYDVWKPTCARVITKTEPVKREVTRKVPGFEWSVEERCAACRQRLAREPACAAP